MSAASALSTESVLLAGKAVFTLEGKGKSWTFRFDTVEADDAGRPPITFVKLLTGPDNTADYTYLGVYRPTEGWVKLTGKSRLDEKAEPVRAIRWVVGKVFNGQETDIVAQGFRLVWSDHCARCGRLLTVSSSVDARLGPECAKKV